MSKWLEADPRSDDIVTSYGRIPAALDRFIAQMPKVEIHLHLEGSVQPATLRDLALKHDIDLPIHDDVSLAALYQFRDFAHFIDIYVSACRCLRAPDDFARVAYEVGVEAARQNTRYLEVHFNPEPHHRKRGISIREQLDGMNAGRERAEREFGVRIRWIADGVRDAESGPASVTQTVEWITALPPDDGVIGLGLGGFEAEGPPELFAADFSVARVAGLHVVAHAGESTGPDWIWRTLRELGAERIGHGVSAIHDPELVRHLAESQIPLEVCPVSNLRTRVVIDPESHPFAALDAAGVLVTVNSDDPPMFGTTLPDEYRFLAATFGYDAPGLARLARNGVVASFLSPTEKAAMLAAFEAECAELMDELGPQGPLQPFGTDVTGLSLGETESETCPRGGPGYTRSIGATARRRSR